MCGHLTPLLHHHRHHHRRRRRRRRQHVKDAAQDVAEDVAEDASQATGRGAELGLRGPGSARPPRHATTTAAAISLQLALR